MVDFRVEYRRRTGILPGSLSHCRAVICVFALGKRKTLMQRSARDTRERAAAAMPSFGMFRDALATMTSGEMLNWMASVETAFDGGEANPALAK
jgi:hypothetical protein